MELKIEGRRLSIVLGILLVIVVLVAAQLAYLKFSNKVVWLEVSGTPGTKVSCEFEINGQKASPVVTPTPRKLSTGGFSIGYSIENIGTTGNMTVQVIVNDRLVSKSTIPEGQRLVGEVGGFKTLNRLEVKKLK